MMCRIAMLTLALLASANAASFLEDRTKMSDGIEESTTDENVVAETSDVNDVDTESLEEEGAEFDGDFGEAQEDISSEEDQESGNEDEDIEIPDEPVEDEDEGTESLLQNPKSTETLDDDETVALASDDAVEDENANEDTEEASEETDEDDSDAAGSSEETSNGDPSVDESADSLQDPSSAESPVAESFSYDDSSTVNMMNVDGLTDSEQAPVKGEHAQLVEDQGADALKDSGSVDAMGSKHNADSAKAKAQPPTNGAAQSGALVGSIAFLQVHNATRLANLISTEVNQVASTSNLLGDGAEAAFLAEVADGAVSKQEETNHGLAVAETDPLKDSASGNVMGSKDHSESAKANVQLPTNGSTPIGSQSGNAASLKPQNATRLATLISTEVEQAIGAENFLGDGAEAEFLAEVTDDTAVKQ